MKDIEESPASRALLIKMEIVHFFFAFSRCNKLSTAGDRSLPLFTNRLPLFTAGNKLYLPNLLGYTIWGETILYNITDIFRDIRRTKSETNSYASSARKLKSTYIHFMNSRNILAGILFGIFISSCSDTPPTSTPNSTTTTSTTNTQKPQLVKLYLTVLDCNLDTINEEIPFEMDSLFTSTEFKSEGHYTITYDKFEKLSKHFTNLDAAQIRILNGIDQKQEYALLKRNFKLPKYQNFKINYVKNINWLEVNATQIGPAISTWGISGSEGIEECANAIKKNYSYAKMYARWQLKYPNAIPFDQYMKRAEDSVFELSHTIVGDIYTFSYGDYQTNAFHFHDLGITADLNGDGIADRGATWHKNVSAGVCGITKKSPKGLIEFFEVELKVLD